MKQLTPNYTVQNKLIMQGLVLGFVLCLIPYSIVIGATATAYMCGAVSILIINKIFKTLKKDETR